MKFYIKIAISYFIYYAGIFSFLKFLKRKNPVVLCYHRIVENFEEEKNYPLPGLLVSKEAFKKQLEFLKKHYILTSMEDFLNGREDNGLLNYEAIITFDDGYKDNYTQAFPILKDCKAPATIFLATDFMEKRYLDTPMLPWDEIKQMSNDSITFGAHTQSHPVYDESADEKYYSEIKTSKQIIEERLNKKIDTFAFPKGIYNIKAVETAKDAGYKAVFSLNKKDEGFVLGRICINEGMYSNSNEIFHLPIFACALVGIWNKPH